MMFVFTFALLVLITSVTEPCAFGMCFLIYGLLELGPMLLVLAVGGFGWVFTCGVEYNLVTRACVWAPRNNTESCILLRRSSVSRRSLESKQFHKAIPRIFFHFPGLQPAHEICLRHGHSRAVLSNWHKTLDRSRLVFGVV